MKQSRKQKSPFTALPIVKIGNPLLRQKAGSIPPSRAGNKAFLLPLLRQMTATLRAARGVGLAANQVGRKENLLVMECRGNARYPRVHSFPLQAYLNVRILHYSKAVEKGWEGCLSIPGFRGLVPRSRQVTFEALTPGGLKVRRTLRGFEARVIQHEVDHLNGRFYIDRIKGWKTWMHLEEFNKRLKVKVRDTK